MAVTDEAIEKIKGMIVSGELRPGDRLPKEADLAAELGLSRNSLREAVQGAVADPGPGRAPGRRHLRDQPGAGAAAGRAGLRRRLPPRRHGAGVPRRCAGSWSRPPPRWRPSGSRERRSARLRALLDSSATDPAVEELVANDLEFHRRIVPAAGNAVLCSLLERLSGPTTRARIWRGLTQEGAVEPHPGEHRAILDALRDRARGGPVLGDRAHRRRGAVAEVDPLAVSPAVVPGSLSGQ